MSKVFELICILLVWLVFISDFSVFAYDDVAGDDDRRVNRLSWSKEFDHIGLTFSWEIDGHSQEIEFGISGSIDGASENGWIALGMSMNGGMKGADIIIFSLLDSRLLDAHSWDEEMPSLDKVNNYDLTYSMVDISNNYVEITFKRNIFACDSEDYNIDPGYLHHFLLLAKNNDDKLLTRFLLDDDGTHGNKLLMSKHEIAESVSVDLFINEDIFFMDVSGRNEIADISDYTIDVLNKESDNIVMDASVSSHRYEERLFYVNKRAKMIGFDIVTNVKHPRTNHHMILYDCNEAYNKYGDTFLNRFDKRGLNFPGAHTLGGLKECEDMLPIGGPTHQDNEITKAFHETMYFPLPKGYYVLQYHFELKYTDGEGINGDDRSGVVLYCMHDDSDDDDDDIDGSISKVVRKHSIGSIATLLGVPNNPKDRFIESFTKPEDIQYSYVVNDACTNAMLPASGINVIGIVAHMHEFGASFLIERIRGGRHHSSPKIDTVYYTKQFDFSRQVMTPVDFKLFANDIIVVTCRYKYSSTRVTFTYNTAVFSGGKDQFEMCTVIFYVTPKLDEFSFVQGRGQLLTTNEFQKHGVNLSETTFCGSAGKTWHATHPLAANTTWSGLEKYMDEKHIFYSNNDNIKNSKIKYDSQNAHDLSRFNRMCSALLYSHLGLVNVESLWMDNIPFVSLFVSSIVFGVLLISSHLIGYFLNKFNGVYKYELNVLNQRRVIIYIMSLIYFTIVLILAIYSAFKCGFIAESECDTIYNEYGDQVKKAMSDCPIVFAGNMLIIFYSWEFLYRINLTWHVIMHHFFVIVISMLVFLFSEYLFAFHLSSRIGIWYLLQPALEQPVFFTFLIHRLKLVDKIDNINPLSKYGFKLSICNLMIFNAIWNFITKLGTSIAVVYWLIGDSRCHFYLYNISFADVLKHDTHLDEIFFNVLLILSLPLFLLQMYQSYSFWRLRKTMGKPKDGGDHAFAPISHEILSLKPPHDKSIRRQLTPWSDHDAGGSGITRQRSSSSTGGGGSLSSISMSP